MSKQRNGYCLFFSGLGEGEHDFEYVLDRRLMEEFPQEENFSDPQVEVSLHLTKADRMMELSFSFHGRAKTQCDRCLKDLFFPVDVREHVLVKIVSQPEEAAEDGESLWWISEKDSFIDLAPYFHEVLVLARPMQCVCETDSDGNPTCDPAMLALFDPQDGKGGKEEGTFEDPRWAALKGLKEKMTD